MFKKQDVQIKLATWFFNDVKSISVHVESFPVPGAVESGTGTGCGDGAGDQTLDTVICRFMSSDHMKAMHFAAWAAWLDDDDSNKVEYGSQWVKLVILFF